MSNGLCRVLLVTIGIVGLHMIAVGQRLPAGGAVVVPRHYQLFLDPNLEAKTFSGEETIDVQIKESSKDIAINSLDLDVSFAEIISNGKAQRAVVSYDKAMELVKLHVGDSPAAGDAQIHLKFSAPLTDSLRGLYLSKSARRTYAVTQFEGTYARMMFPCFDEPNFKATFDLSVTAAKSDTAISNGRIVSDKPTVDGMRHTLVFSTSPKMSTYLVALAIGDWQCLERDVEGTHVRVCAVPEKKEMGAFALDVATHSLEFYNSWYGIPYPFGKLDMLAVPDYEWGGMENTASIFYRDSALLMDEKTSSVFAKRGHATVIAHEIAHQWFGDLVTPVWWDDIWLNEGFATWMETKPIAAWHPEWHLEDDEAMSAQQVISLDSLGATRAIHGDPKTPSEIKEMFDGITYEKGGAVLSMLESYVGAEPFRKGVNAYLQAHANGNATAADFWSAMTQASGKPVDQIMPTFVLQPGVPVLSVGTSCASGKESVDFEQQRFLLAAKSQPSVELWQIPVCMKGPNSAAGSCAVVAEQKKKIELDGCPDWLYANRDAKGYYRVAYAPDNLKKISAAAEKELNTPERIALVEDAWAMSRAGRSPIADFMGLTTALRTEHELAVLDLLSGHLDYVEGALVTAGKADAYRKFVREQFSALAAEVGWNASAGDSDEKKALRASLLGILGRADDPAAVAKARELVQQYFKDPGSVEGTIAGEAFIVAGAHGDAAFYDQVLARLQKSQSAEEYNLCLGALTAAQDPALAQRTLGLVDEGTIRQQDYPQFFGALLANSASREAAWGYLKAHWEMLAEKVTSFGGRGAVSSLGNACSVEMRDDVKQFFASHKAPGAERTVQQSLERIDGCVEFKREHADSMQKWMETL